VLGVVTPQVSIESLSGDFALSGRVDTCSSRVAVWFLLWFGPRSLVDMGTPLSHLVLKLNMIVIAQAYLMSGVEIGRMDTSKLTPRHKGAKRLQ